MTEITKSLAVTLKELEQTKKRYFVIFIIYTIIITLVLISFGYFFLTQKKDIKYIYVDKQKECLTKKINNNNNNNNNNNKEQKNNTNNIYILYNKNNKKCSLIKKENFNKFINNKKIKNILKKREYKIFKGSEFTNKKKEK